ncbi:hypothetical protein GCM10022247_39390 [Allokutzneria multivorans]|uniref:Pentapeptide repeat-containing protein n=1 Tax=Allokutzneria multivorans TaxID=1142134 RepID=A0ABP7SKT5_9PSEU
MALRWFRATAVTLLVLALIAAALWLPDMVVSARAAGLTATEQLAAISTVRAQYIQIVSTAGGLVTVWYGIRKYFLDKEKQRLDQDKHVTDRFSAAVGHLGSGDETVRAGGVRTLERIMADSPRDHEAVVDTISGLLRHHAGSAPERSRLRDDVVAAVNALRTRPDRAESDPLDLAGVVLPGVSLRRARLSGASLASAHLSRANLEQADLSQVRLLGTELGNARMAGSRLDGADLTGATAKEADLTGASAVGATFTRCVLSAANFTDADLTGANLSRARLRDASMTGTRLSGADLTDADLSGVDLRTAIGLTADSLRNAVTDSNTLLPDFTGSPPK